MSRYDGPDYNDWPNDIERGDPGHPFLELLAALLFAAAILGLCAFIVVSSW